MASLGPTTGKIDTTIPETETGKRDQSALLEKSPPKQTDLNNPIVTGNALDKEATQLAAALKERELQGQFQAKKQISG